MWSLCVCSVSCVFFFKQKTAYEMRISDWSSDVCSSDLPVLQRADAAAEGRLGHVAAVGRTREIAACGQRQEIFQPVQFHGRSAGSDAGQANAECVWPVANLALAAAPRSEEHTSELQSLMRTSYAVFCLKKKIPHCIQYLTLLSDNLSYNDTPHISIQHNI